MTPHQIPIVKTKPIKRISPSRYFSLKSCVLRELFASDVDIPELLPKHPSVRIGVVIHKLFELTATGQITSEESVQSYWKELIKCTEDDMKRNWLEYHIVPLSKSTRNFDVKKQQCFRIIKSMIDFRMSTEPKYQGQLKAECWVQTEDGLVGGRIDAFRFNNDGVDLLDFKTGEFLEDIDGTESIKQAYKIQLKIYAALFYLKFGYWPNKLVIVGLNQNEFIIPFNQSECLSLLKEVRSKIIEINNCILAGFGIEEFANPDNVECMWCSYRPICKKYLEALRRNIIGKRFDVWGNLTKKRIMGNGLYQVTLETLNEEIKIRGLSPNRYPLLGKNNSGSLLICNLNADNIGSNFYENLLTTIYEVTT